MFALNHKHDAKKLNTYNFIKTLVKSLTRPNIERRPLSGLNIALQNDIKVALRWVDATETAGPQVIEASQPSTFRSLYSPKSETRKRCYACVSNAHGPGCKKPKPTNQLQKSMPKRWKACLLQLYFANRTRMLIL